MPNEVTIARDGGREIRFEENDVRQACRIMMCGDHVDDCIALMKQGRNVGCALCYAVLQAGRRPFRARKEARDPPHAIRRRKGYPGKVPGICRSSTHTSIERPEPEPQSRSDETPLFEEAFEPLSARGVFQLA